MTNRTIGCGVVFFSGARPADAEKLVVCPTRSCAFPKAVKALTRPHGPQGTIHADSKFVLVSFPSVCANAPSTSWTTVRNLIQRPSPCHKISTTPQFHHNE